MLFYIHGFASDGLRSAISLENCLNKPINRLFWRSEENFEFNLKSLLEQVKSYEFKNRSSRDNIFIGSSMGGFYSGLLSSILKQPCVLFNPVTDPKVTLKQFLGQNTNYATGEKFYLSQEVIDSYIFQDPRNTQINRIVILGNQDQIVDHKTSKLYWENFAKISIVNMDHQVPDYLPFADLINSVMIK